MNKFDIYEKVTNLIIERLEEGVVPWQMPWKSSGSIPCNLISKRPYTGFNFWYLLSFGFERPYFLTFNQIKDIGARIKKGSESYMVIFWKMVQKEKDGEIEEIPYLRYYRVFHVDDLENVDTKLLPDNANQENEFSQIGACENLIKNWKDAPGIIHGKHNACYVPSIDKVYMPDQKCFIRDEEYYSTLFHELTHSTGHTKRLNRHMKCPNHKFGSKDYSQEELVAEMGAAFLCGTCGIENATIDNSAAYIKGWLRKLKNDKKFILSASSLAQKAVDYILQNQKVSAVELAEV